MPFNSNKFLGLFIFMVSTNVFAATLCGIITKDDKKGWVFELKNNTKNTFGPSNENTIKKARSILIIPLNEDVDKQMPLTVNSKELCVVGTLNTLLFTDIGKFEVWDRTGSSSNYLYGYVTEVNFFAYKVF